MITNGGAKTGDRLILTKPLGTGIINTAIKAGMVDNVTIEKVSNSMSTLNKAASEAMQEAGVHLCTDITGFGMLGHIVQMAVNSGICLKIKAADIPFFAEATTLANKGLCPAGLYKNRDFYAKDVIFAKSVPDFMRDLLFDPQTSGGLFISVSSAKSEKLLSKLHDAGVIAAAIVGEVTGEPEGKVSVV